MEIFITGRPGTGKTTLIKKLSGFLGDRSINISGFYTEEIREDGKRRGFTITTIPEKNNYILSTIEPPGIRFGRYFVKTEGMDKAINTLLRKADMYIIDEVGPMEMKHPDFLPAVEKLLDNNKNIIAVIHRKMTHLADRETLYRVTIENREELFVKLKEYINGDIQ